MGVNAASNQVETLHESTSTKKSSDGSATTFVEVLFLVLHIYFRRSDEGLRKLVEAMGVVEVLW